MTAREVNKEPSWLGGQLDESGNDPYWVFPLEEIKTKFDVRELTPGHGWLVLNDDDGWLRFAVVDFYHSEYPDKNVMTKIVFYGGGPTGSLRECRHTYWGEDGYLCYPSGPLICAAFNALSEFYDDMKEQT